LLLGREEIGSLWDVRKFLPKPVCSFGVVREEISSLRASTTRLDTKLCSPLHEIYPKPHAINEPAKLLLKLIPLHRER